MVEIVRPPFPSGLDSSTLLVSAAFAVFLHQNFRIDSSFRLLEYFCFFFSAVAPEFHDLKKLAKKQRQNSPIPYWICYGTTLIASIGDAPSSGFELLIRNKRQPVEFEDIQPRFKLARKDCQFCFFDTSLQLHQERSLRFNTNNLVPSENLSVVQQERWLESPWWDIRNHVVPFGELRLPSMKAAINRSNHVHEGTENLAVVCSKCLERLLLMCPGHNELDLVQDGLKGKEESLVVTWMDGENRVSLDVDPIQPPFRCITTELICQWI